MITIHFYPHLMKAWTRNPGKRLKGKYLIYRIIPKPFGKIKRPY
jgi:hypothetical protein